MNDITVQPSNFQHMASREKNWFHKSFLRPRESREKSSNPVLTAGQGEPLVPGSNKFLAAVRHHSNAAIVHRCSFLTSIIRIYWSGEKGQGKIRLVHSEYATHPISHFHSSFHVFVHLTQFFPLLLQMVLK